MSFSGTPLGQGRRLDHQTFLNKNRRLPSPQRQIPTSYSYGAPTLVTRSPPKPSDRTVGDSDEPALARYARLKQREQSSRSVAPGIINSPPHPEKWTVKDTSVNIATAFHQAASSTLDMQPNNSNNSWASGSRPPTNVPRSTSVEYEAQSQSTSSRRLAVPPNRLAVPPTTAGLKPLSKNASVRHVPDSEEEPEPVDQIGREKSPFEQVLDITKQALSPVTFYLRQRSHEPEMSTEQPAPANGKDASYDYSAEEREYQALQNQRISAKRPNATHKRGRMSTDNKAYRPSLSDLEASDEDFDDDDKRGRKKKKKKEPHGGPLVTLPVAEYKKKKKRPKGSRGNLAGPDDEDESGSDEHISEQQSITHRTSVPRASAPPLSRASVPRGSIPPEPQYNARPEDDSMDVETGLTSIPEVDEHQLDTQDQPSSARPFSVGVLLGKSVHWLYQTVIHAVLFFLQGLSMIFFLFGRVLGTAFDIALNRPARWISHSNPGPVITLAKYLVVALTLYGAWYALRDPFTQFLPTRPSSATYSAPDIPAANIVELSARLQRIENVLTGLSQEHERSRLRQETELKNHGELVGRLGSLESRVQRETIRAVDAEMQARASTSQTLEAVKQQVEVLHAQLRGQQNGGVGVGVNDEEARAKLKALEERVGSVEGGVKEALEIGKSSLKAVGTATSAGAAWWNKLASGSPSKSALTIKSADGQDVTSLIGYLVDSAVSQYGKDVLARPDFALHSGGAQIIPSLTSSTYEISPPNLRGQIVGFITGHGYAIGRPPVTALHHELHNGHCWPFAGSEGQLGVALAAPTYISDVTIDHVAKEVAFDMRSAPKEMEVWALVEGKDNTGKVRAWQAEKARRREEGRARAEAEGTEFVGDDDMDVYPKTLPKFPQYIRIASFSYDINAPNNVQTFPVSQEIRDLGVDFGVVVLRIKSNWGRSEFTCLYRLRVHGQRVGSESS